MSRNTLPSLEQLIRRRIRNRIILAVLILIAVLSVQTAVEITKSVSVRIGNLKERATVLQDLVTSEVLVHNTAAVEAILQDANATHPNEVVHWIPPENQNDNEAEGVQWSLSGSWVFKTPLRSWGDQKFGAFVFTGNFLKEDALISTLLYRAMYVIVFSAVLCLFLLPIAKKAPNDLILKPMRRLVSLVSAERDDQVALESHEFSEIKDLENELRLLLAERRLRVEERIEAEQSRAITQAAQMLAHDIRRPFALIKAALDGMAQARTAELAKKLADKSLPRVNNAFLTLDAMLDELMMLGRPQVIPAVQVDLREVIEQAMETSLGLHPGFEGRTSLDIAEDLFVNGHSGNLQRVISNLTVNALQVMSPTDTLRVSGIRDGDFVTLRVENTGSHIPPEDQASIFKLFYTKGKSSGLGIGLAICKRIVSNHSGKIRVESSPEAGTAFVISLPAAPESSADSNDRKRSPKAKRTGARRLLVADDDIFFRESIEDTAHSLGDHVQVTLAGTAEEAIRLAMSQNFDLIVIDINFGDDRMDGITAVRHMRYEKIKSKICVHTSDSSRATKDLAVDAGADAFIPKPITKEALRRVLS